MQAEITYLSSVRNYKKNTFIHYIKNKLSKDRMNFIFDDLEENWREIEEWGEDTFSWFVLFGTKPFESEKYVEFVVEEKKVESVLEQDQKYLLERWKKDYVECVLKNYSDRFQKSQYLSLKDRFLEGSHYLYYYQDKLVGHGCWVKDKHSIFETECLYWHQWVDQNEPLFIRQQIHKKFFKELYSYNICPMSGVSVANRKSLEHCMRNGFKPVMLSVRFQGEKK